jgi:hypothetical protein
MADDSKQNSPASQPGRAHLASDVENELYALVDALLDEQMTPAQVHRLELLVTSDAAVAQLYLALMHEWGSIPLYITPASIDLTKSDPWSSSKNIMDETMIMPAVCETDFDQDFDQDETAEAPPAILQQPKQSTKSKRWWGGAAAAILLVGFATLWLSPAHPHGPAIVANSGAPHSSLPNSSQTSTTAEFPVRVTATAAIDADAASATAPGTTLNAGQFVQLATGAMELTFSSGAVVVVKGPARFHAIDQNSIALESGELTAHVPAPAMGFRVISPGLWVVDRGTNFGVRSHADSVASEVHVFDGIVDVSGTDGAGQMNSQAVRISTGQALSHNASSASAPVAIPFAGQTFGRDISQARIRIPLPDTGDHVSPGVADPNWQVTAVPNNPNFQPRSAIVISDFPPKYGDNYANDKSPGKWIGMNKALDDQPVGIFKFQTSVDLSDFDPSTVTASVAMRADDRIIDIVVNGISTGITSQAKDGTQAPPASLPPNLWRSGLNKLEVVVQNDPLKLPIANFMTLKLGWTATAIPLVRR